MKIILLPAMLFCFSSPIFSQFDFYSTAVFVKINDNSVFYNNTAPGNGQNIGTENFQNANLGTFTKNAGTLRVLGAEVKTFKSNGNDVCGATLFFTVYPAGTRPASPVYTSIGLGFYADCNEGTCGDKWGAFEPAKGGGCCNAGDQKWQYPAGGNGGGNNGDIDLTGYEPGDYTLEVYYQISGHDNGNTGCNDSRYDNNNSAPANYTANFSISTPLPASLGSLTAQSSKTGNRIIWTTLTEQNLKSFQIEKSTNGNSFTRIGSVIARGNSNQVQTYSYTDASVTPGTAYYRLQMVDHSGLSRYSPVVKAMVTNATPLGISPNPAKDVVVISGAETGAQVRILNAAGAVMRQMLITGQNYQASLIGLSPGKYTVQVLNGSSINNLPLLIVK